MRVAVPLALPDLAACTFWPTGHPGVDAALGGGLLRGRVHEIHAAEAEDISAAAGFAVATALGLAGAAGEILVLRSRRAVVAGGVLQGAGWADLGGAPERALFGVLADDLTLLRAAVDALRSAAVAVVIVETSGAVRALDLTASRRLSLAAEKSGVSLLLVRGDAPPQPSAAQTRWQVAAAPSQALLGHAPGAPAFAISLLRQRAGPAGFAWTLEWDRDRQNFRDPVAAAHSGAVVPLAPRRTLVAGAGAGAGEQGGDRAAA